MSKTRIAAAFAAGLLLLTGCSDDGDEAATDETTSEESPSEETTDATEDSTEETEGAETEEPAEAPEGMELVTAEKSAISFAAPEDWQVIDKAAFSDPEAAKRLEEYAKSVNLTTDQLQQLFQQVDLIVVGENGENLNVTPPGTVPALPTEDQIRQQFQTINATVESVEETDTPLGQGPVVYYKIPTPDGERYGAGLFVEAATGVVNLTVTMSSADDARSLMEQIIPTLQNV